MKSKVISLFTGIGGMDMGFDGEVIVHEDSIINKEFVDKPSTIKDFVVLKKITLSVYFKMIYLKGQKKYLDLIITILTIIQPVFII